MTKQTPKLKVKLTGIEASATGHAGIIALLVIVIILVALLPPLAVKVLGPSTTAVVAWISVK